MDYQYESFEEYFNDITKGVRVRSLKRFLFFVAKVKERLKTLDWNEWSNRDCEHRKNLRPFLITYLSHPDKGELDYFTKRLGSQRMVYDYWKTFKVQIEILGLDNVMVG